MTQNHRKNVKNNTEVELSTNDEIGAFLAELAHKSVSKVNQGRLLFILDATASRQLTWDTACNLQAKMFEVVDNVGKLEVQLAYYYGFRHFKYTDWHKDAAKIVDHMTHVRCAAGATQIRRAFLHAQKEHRERKLSAVVFVGDCMEEPIDEVCESAGQLGLLGVPVFMFQEGREPTATYAFQEIARLSKGYFCRFDANSAVQLRALLSAVAVYAVGGLKALSSYGSTGGKEAAKVVQKLLSNKS